jgi:hypothetical protein
MSDAVRDKAPQRDQEPHRRCRPLSASRSTRTEFGTGRGDANKSVLPLARLVEGLHGGTRGCRRVVNTTEAGANSASFRSPRPAPASAPSSTDAYWTIRQGRAVLVDDRQTDRRPEAEPTYYVRNCSPTWSDAAGRDCRCRIRPPALQPTAFKGDDQLTVLGVQVRLLHRLPLLRSPPSGKKFYQLVWNDDKRRHRSRGRRPATAQAMSESTRAAWWR